MRKSRQHYSADGGQKNQTVLVVDTLFVSLPTQKEDNGAMAKDQELLWMGNIAGHISSISSSSVISPHEFQVHLWPS